MKKRLLAIIMLLPFFVKAQVDRCGVNGLFPGLESQVPLTGRITEDSTTILKIPVVIHLLHLRDPIGSQHNPSEAKIRETIEYLNQAFRAKWLSYPDTLHGGVDTRIEFVLANRDTLGRVSNGINRIDASGYPEYAQFGRIPPGFLLNFMWNRHKYLNIWVFHKLQGSGGFGISPRPPNEPVLNPEGFGILSSIFKPGESVLPHEAGHYLGLHHTWGIAFGNTCPANGNCETDGDEVCDTEPHGEFASCDRIGTINPCTGLPYGNTLRNFMSYAAPTCRDRFTRLQTKKMRLTIMSSRPGIINNELTVSRAVTIRELDEIKILPNPNSGNFTVSLVGPVSGAITISIINNAGQLVYRKEMELNMQKDLPVSFPGLNAGIYFISIRDQTGVLSSRMLVR
jgi:hypothetical protein